MLLTTEPENWMIKLGLSQDEAYTVPVWLLGPHLVIISETSGTSERIFRKICEQRLTRRQLFTSRGLCTNSKYTILQVSKNER